MLMLVTLVMLLVAVPVQARIQVVEIDSIKAETEIAWYDQLLHTPRQNVLVPTKEIAYKEIYSIEENLPALKTVNWTVYVIPKEYVVNETIINTDTHETINQSVSYHGFAMSTSPHIYIFASENYNSEADIRATIAHEIGHMVHFRLLGEDNLNQYITTKTSGIWYDSSQYIYRSYEVFAEDFRKLFGSPEAQQKVYRPGQVLPQPTEFERLWININIILKGGKSIES